MKTQTIRLADVFFVGPVMIYGGLKLASETENRLLGNVLALLGAATIVYNGRNYLKLQEAGESAGALSGTPETHQREALEDLTVMGRLVGETEENVRRGRCKDALASAGKAAVAAGKVERNLPYDMSGRVQAAYRPLNDRRMASRDAFASACMRK